MKECCDLKKNDEKIPAQCQKCGNIGRPVKRTTLEHLLKEEKLSFMRDAQYFFCSTLNCDVVYFSNKENAFYKTDLKIRVGIKETEEPIPVCYCFGYTKKMILDDIAQNGHSTTETKIKDAIKKGVCRCELTNPEGICCLGNVRKVIKEGMAEK